MPDTVPLYIRDKAVNVADLEGHGGEWKYIPVGRSLEEERKGGRKGELGFDEQNCLWAWGIKVSGWGKGRR